MKEFTIKVETEVKIVIDEDKWDQKSLSEWAKNFRSFDQFYPVVQSLGLLINRSLLSQDPEKTTKGKLKQNSLLINVGNGTMDIRLI